MNQTGTAATIDSHKDVETTVAIIGSGFSGLCMAIQLSRRGRDDFLILEKSHDIGGTWRDNTYPGCACDVPTAIYSYSFEQNPYWSKMWSSQPEIQAYLQRITDKYDLRRKAVFGTEIVAAHWDDAASRWHLRSAEGRTITAQFVVLGVGPLNVPRLPKLNGIESFTGSVFHSAQWDRSADLTGKKVAVIGTGASAIQFVPIIAEQVGQLQLYQRSPAWVLGRKNPTIPKALQKLFAKVPLTRNVFRAVAFGSRSRWPWGSTDTATCISRWNGPPRPTSARASRIRRWRPSSPPTIRSAASACFSPPRTTRPLLGPTLR